MKPDNLIMTGVSLGDLLTAFRHDIPYLFLGAAFVAAGVLSAGFAVLRRKSDSLLIYFGLFATLYGLRLWIWSPLLEAAEYSSTFYNRLHGAINYVILIPAFLFFIPLGLSRQFERVVGYAMVTLSSILAAAAILFGDCGFYDRTRSIAIIVASGFFLMRFLSRRSAKPRGLAGADFVMLRWGLLIFLGFVLSQNLVELFEPSWPLLEPFGFAAFVTTLGYVAVRTTLRRDEQLSEIRKELEVAHRIQLSILPTQFPHFANFQVAARYVPMTSVAGDLYDYIIADEHHVGLLIADVSGHGVPAALIASMVKMAAASQRSAAADPSQFLSGMNAALLGNTQNQFVTAAYVHLNSESREMRYSAAGHPPLLIVRNGGITEIEENGLVLAVFGSASYSNAVHKLEEGDRIVMCTDGILEAANAAGEFFGEAMLYDLLSKTRGMSPAIAADSIMSSVRRWSGRQDDDLTLLICDYIPRTT